MPRDVQPESGSNRRDFLKTGTAVAMAGTLGMNLSMSSGLYAAGNDILKVGLVGCGGRGTGAAREALKADPQTRMVAMGDAFPEQIEGSINSLKGVKDLGERVVVDADHKFTGLEAYKQVIDAVDVVVLASPPGFRPYHLRYAVEKGKHIFTEKPMATDAPGVRSVMETVAMAKEKNLALVAGFCWRYDYARRELFQRVHDGAIGDVVGIYGTYLTSPVKPMPPEDTRPKGMSDLEWMVRNWYNFTWLSGDGLVEQAIHTVDWLAWTMNDVPALSCTAVGGRQIPAHGGNIYDHIEVNYLWESGARGFLAQRQIAGCHNENNLYIQGTKGTGNITGRGVFITGDNAWKYSGPGNNMYQTEHDEFFASIRSGKPLNDGDRMTKSTLLGIMGRMAGYTGQQVTWEMAMNSQEELVPDLKDFKAEVKAAPMARPGFTPFV